jgi:hypothetical protein
MFILELGGWFLAWASLGDIPPSACPFLRVDPSHRSKGESSGRSLSIAIGAPVGAAFAIPPRRVP